MAGHVNVVSDALVYVHLPGSSASPSPLKIALQMSPVLCCVPLRCFPEQLQTELIIVIPGTAPVALHYHNYYTFIIYNIC